MTLIDKIILERTSIAIKCISLNLEFYKDIENQGISAKQVFAKKNKYLAKGSSWFKNDARLEESFRWLIKTGVLRREVDGQGLTAKVKLTPLGKKILARSPSLPSEVPTTWEKLNNWFFKLTNQ